MQFFGITVSEEQFNAFLLLYGGNLIAAILILSIGWFAVKFLRQFVQRIMLRAHLEPLLVNFASNILYGLALTFVVIAALNKLGVQTTSLVAILGAAGLAIGLALQGSLSNFAAGIMIIVFKHFRIGDTISFNNITGTVSDMNIFTTTLNTATNERIVAPNSMITGSILTNISAHGERRVDLLITVSYAYDMDAVTAVLQEVVSAETRALKKPSPAVQLEALTDGGIVFAVRVWTKTPNWGNVKSDLQKQIKLAFDRAGIIIPPQRDLNVRLSESKAKLPVEDDVAPATKDPQQATRRKRPSDTP